MVLFHKFLVTQNTGFCGQSEGNNLSNPIEFKFKFKDIDVSVLAVFFLATKLCNELISVNRISSYYINSNLILRQSKNTLINNNIINNNQSNHNSSNINEQSRLEGIIDSQEKPSLQTMACSRASSSTNVSAIEKKPEETNDIINNKNSFSKGSYNCITSSCSNNTSTNYKSNNRYIVNCNENNKASQHQDSLNSIKKLLEEKVKARELEILAKTGFDLSIELPYKYIDAMQEYFKQYLRNSERLIEITYYYINDSFKTPLCLYYHPMKIALAVMLLLNWRHEVQLVETKDKIQWFRILDKSIELTEIEEIAKVLLNMYSLFNPKESRLNVKSPEKALEVLIAKSSSDSQEGEKAHEVFLRKKILTATAQSTLSPQSKRSKYTPQRNGNHPADINNIMKKSRSNIFQLNVNNRKSALTTTTENLCILSNNTLNLREIDH